MMFVRALVVALLMTCLAAGDAEARTRKHRAPHKAPAVTSQTVQPAAKDEGPDLQYSCATIRFHAWIRGFKRPLTGEMRQKIAALEKANNITPKQHRQAEACFIK